MDPDKNHAPNTDRTDPQRETLAQSTQDAPSSTTPLPSAGHGLRMSSNRRATMLFRTMDHTEEPIDDPHNSPELNAQRRHEYESVRTFNRTIAAVIENFEQAHGNIQEFARTMERTENLLDFWTATLSQSEEAKRILENPEWRGITAQLQDDIAQNNGEADEPPAAEIQQPQQQQRQQRKQLQTSTTRVQQQRQRTTPLYQGASAHRIPPKRTPSRQTLPQKRSGIADAASSSGTPRTKRVSRQS
ncbi:DASH complex subunit Duo1-domain-containing protein [Syncephalastrum racemosum]|uniref:DASH complex subunit DUO1 n=1 Tax=Syncephalastrum racemosum TaxID=13706 RepID=A0A1X2H1M8_SYNRA|nr:DASH complex subunit Duo1-domain-containing protein [Syncephalastrum racemosum]